MSIIRRAVLAAALLAGLSPSFAQAPPPVPALPDTERRTSYSITSSNCACSVGFALYGDSTDYQNWVEVYLNGVLVNYNDPTFGWAITSPSNADLSRIARPITDGVLTFTNAQTGTVQIVGARRPRRVSQFAENRGVAARDLNQAITDIIAQNREIWDKTNDFTGRGLFSQPGNRVGPLPLPSTCAGGFLAFDGTGLNPVCIPPPTLGTGVVGTNPTVIGNIPKWGNTTGSFLGNSALTDDGTKVSTTEPIDLTSKSLLVEVANASSTGTTVNKLAKLTGAPSTALITATTDTAGAMGIVVGGAGTTGNALIATAGQANCAFDGATVAGDYVQQSTTTAGDCHDAGSTFPTTGQIIGRVLSTNASAGSYAVALSPEVHGTASVQTSFISTNTTLAVPGTFATIPLALASLQNAIIADGATVTIQVTGHQTYTSQINILNPYGYNIVISGATTTTTAISSSGAATGSAGAWNINYTVGSSTGISIGDLVGVEGAGSGNQLHNGAWIVSAVPDGTHVTVTNTSRSPTTPSTGATGTLRIYPTQLTFTGVSGFWVSRLGGLQEIALIGNGGPTGGTFGVIGTGNDHTPQGHVILGPHLAASSFMADNIRANYGGVIIASTVTSSNAGNNGFLARDLGHINCITNGACVSSGNGFGTFPGGGNGFLAENTSSILQEGSVAYGNGGDGFFARTTSAMLCDNSFPCIAIANNRNNFHVAYLGYFQSAGAFSATSNGSGFFAEENSTMLVQGSESNGAANGGDGYFAQNGAFIDASGGTIVVGTTAGCAFLAAGPGANINAQGASVSGTISGSAAYCATSNGWVTMTGALGTATSSPTANTGAVPPAGFVKN
jgi:hypothetical protein